MFLSKLNPVEPPWYVTRMPGGVGGVAPRGVPLSRSITVYDARELYQLTFFHIKLELHDVIYAEGAPCETLLSVDENAINFAEYPSSLWTADDQRCSVCAVGWLWPPD
jgi:hypothetical protein